MEDLNRIFETLGYNYDDHLLEAYAELIINYEHGLEEWERQENKE